MGVLKVGLVGCGKIADANHMPEMLSLGGNAEVTAMFDIQKGKAEARRTCEGGRKARFFRGGSRACAESPDATSSSLISEAISTKSPQIACHFRWISPSGSDCIIASRTRA